MPNSGGGISTVDPLLISGRYSDSVLTRTAAFWKPFKLIAPQPRISWSHAEAPDVFHLKISKIEGWVLASWRLPTGSHRRLDLGMQDDVCSVV